jgi:ribosomal protein S18
MRLLGGFFFFFFLVCFNRSKKRSLIVEKRDEIDFDKTKELHEYVAQLEKMVYDSKTIHVTATRAAATFKITA